MNKELILQDTEDSKLHIRPHVDYIYPIGSIYMSVNDVDPSELFGGIWELFSRGRTIVGIDEGDSDFDESEKIGGNGNHIHNLNSHTHTSTSHTHTVGAHTHNLDANGAACILIQATTIATEDGVTTTGWNRRRNININSAVSDGGVFGHGTPLRGRTTAMTAAANTGSTTPGVTGVPSNNNTNQQSNLQPYITCYIFKRVA